MRSNRRVNYLWVVLLGIAVAMVLLSNAATPIVGAALLAAYLGVLGVVAFGALDWRRIRSAVPSIKLGVQATTAGRRAMQQARTQPGYLDDHAISDVGLIANVKQNGQLARRLAQIVSQDDDAIQPYTRVYAPGSIAQRLALVKFEIFDHSGQIRFSHEVEHWMREGNNTIICDRQLPLRDDDSLKRSRMWDLRISVDGALVGIHSFNVTPSQAARRQRLTNDGEFTEPSVQEEPGDVRPLSLEDLLREQKQQSSERRS